MRSIKTILTVSCLALGAAGWSAAGGEIDLSKLPPAAQKEGVTYDKDIKPLFDASCVRCHSGSRPKAGLRLDSLDGALKGGKEGKVIVPGKSSGSDLVIAVSRLDPEKAMPPKPKPGRGGPGGPPPADAGAGGGAAPAGGPPAGGPPPGGPGGGRGFGPPPKPLTAEQVGLVRAWIDQGAK